MANDIYVQRSGKVAVGVKFSGSCPEIHDIDWSPSPKDCRSQHTQAMLACGSDEGTGIYKFVRGNPKQLRWMGYGDNRFFKLYESPKADGTTKFLKFHPSDGRILVTVSKTGLLTLLGYDTNRNNFIAMSVHELERGVSSLSWSLDGRYLAVSRKPKSAIALFALTQNEDSKRVKLEFLGEAPYPNLPKNSEVHTIFGSEALYTCSNKDKYITIWHLESGANLRLTPIYKVECGTGVIALSMTENGEDEFLVTLYDNDTFKLWKMATKSSLPILQDEGIFVCGNTDVNHVKYGVPSCSQATAIDASRPYHTVTVGVNEVKTMNTVALHVSFPSNQDNQDTASHLSCAKTALKHAAHRMNVIKFNPNSSEDQMGISFVMGGEGGFMHFWSVANREQSFKDIGFKDEQYYYLGRRTKKEWEKYIPEDMDIDDGSTWLPDESADDFSNVPPGSLEMKIVCIHSVAEQEVDSDTATHEGSTQDGSKKAATGSEYDPEDDSDQDLPSDGEHDENKTSRETGTRKPTLIDKLKAARERDAKQMASRFKTIDKLSRELHSEIDASARKLKTKVDSYTEEVKLMLEDNEYEPLCEYACKKMESLRIAIGEAHKKSRRVSVKEGMPKEEVIKLTRDLSVLVGTEDEPVVLPRM